MAARILRPAPSRTPTSGRGVPARLAPSSRLGGRSALRARATGALTGHGPALTFGDARKTRGFDRRGPRSWATISRPPRWRYEHRARALPVARRGQLPYGTSYDRTRATDPGLAGGRQLRPSREPDGHPRRRGLCGARGPRRRRSGSLAGQRRSSARRGVARSLHAGDDGAVFRVPHESSATPGGEQDHPRHGRRGTRQARGGSLGCGPPEAVQDRADAQAAPIAERESKRSRYGLSHRLSRRGTAAWRAPPRCRTVKPPLDVAWPGA